MATALSGEFQTHSGFFFGVGFYYSKTIAMEIAV